MSQELLDNSLKLGEQLLREKNLEGALALFHEVIMSKRKGNLDKIMIRHVETCADLENLSTLKEALLVYRNLVQNTSPQSLQQVLEKLRFRVEEKVSNTFTLIQGNVEVIDLEVEDPPEILLINSVRDSQGSIHESVVNSLRFLWEIYKVSLDLLKTNGRMVNAYKDSAISAIAFCEKYKRPNECRKLSEILRGHLQNIIRIQNTQTNVSLTYMMKLDEDTLKNLIPIREKLMDVCMELGLWQETFRAAEDTRQLICEGKASPSTLARYWFTLSRIFWKAGQHMFHAYALYLYYYQNKKHNTKFSKETHLSSSIVLSILAVPTFRLGSDITGITTESILSQEINQRLSTMLLQSGMITREQLIDLIHTNNLLEIAIKEVRELFHLLENKFSPLNLSHLVKPILAKLKEHPEYKIYVPAIEQLLVGRVLAQLSKCYKSLKLESLYKLIDFIPAETLEKYILEISIKTSLYIKIDHSTQAIYFKDVPDILEACTKFNKVKQSLVKAYYIVNKDQEAEKRKMTMKNVFANLDEITNQAFEFRQNLTDDGKRIVKERDEALRKKEEEEKKIREIEKKKYEEEMKQREKTQKIAGTLIDIEKQRRELKLSIIGNIIEKMKSFGFSSKEMSYNGVKIEKMTEDQLLEVGPEELGKLYSKLYDKSVKDKQIQVKQQQKVLEYNERAKREYMNPLILAKWAESTQQEIDSKKTLIKEKYDKDLALKKQFERIKDLKQEYITEETEKAKLSYDEVYNTWLVRMKDYYKAAIIDMAKNKRTEDINAKIEEDRRLKEENERRKKADELKKKEINFERKSIFRKEPTAPSTSGGLKRSDFIPAPAPVPVPVPEKTNSFRSNFNNPPPAVKEERKIDAPPKRYTNSKRKEIVDQDGFTKVTKDSHH